MVNTVTVLAHGVAVDGSPRAAALTVLTVDADGTFTVTPFDGVESHSTVFVSGTVSVATGGDGSRALSVTDGAGRTLWRRAITTEIH